MVFDDLQYFDPPDIGYRFLHACSQRRNFGAQSQTMPRGPAGCFQPFPDDDTDAAMAMANATDYGLAASIWTTNLAIAHKRPAASAPARCSATAKGRNIDLEKKCITGKDHETRIEEHL